MSQGQHHSGPPSPPDEVQSRQLIPVVLETLCLLAWSVPVPATVFTDLEWLIGYFYVYIGNCVSKFSIQSQFGMGGDTHSLPFLHPTPCTLPAILVSLGSTGH